MIASRHRASRLLALLAALALVGGLALAVSGCGDDEEAIDLIDRAFATPIGSADVALDTSLELQGVPRLQGPLRLRVNGPYKSGGSRKIPSLDWAVNFTGAGQNFAGALVSTGDNAWVELLGQAYEVGEQQTAAVNQQLAAAAGQQRRSLKEFGVDPRRWLVDPSIEGEEEIAGVPTQHVSAGIDVARLLEDFNTLSQRAGQQVGGPTPQQLSAEQRERVERIVQDPEFDVYVGDDNKVRRLSTVLDLEVPKEDRRAAGGAESGRVSFSIDFTNVGRPSPITPPSQAKPISELTQQLLQLFGGGAAGGAGAVPEAPGGVPAPQP